VNVAEVQAPGPAGFWIRALALGVDLAIVLLVQKSFALMATALLGPVVEPEGGQHPSVAFFTLVFSAAYTTVLHAFAGQTIGKSLVGVRVVALDGTPLTAGAALLRYLSYYISAIPLGFGFLVAGLRRDKRALHDLITGSRVEHVAARRRFVRRPPPVVQPPEVLQDPAVPHATEPRPGA
jgi:uncharacterized RDD family membrane protein YckC